MVVAFRRRWCRVAWLLCAGAAAAAQPSQGLIVRLKDAPPHERLQPRDGAQAQAESERWQRVLREAGLSGASGQRAPRLRPVGRDQQWLDFGRRLSADETARWALRLRRRADVDWVDINTLEHRLAVPRDPQFGLQWWLLPAGGSNANALADRLRGVPGFQRAWATGQPGATGHAVVAVLDTGVTDHPDLAGHLLPGYDFVSDPAYANDGDGRDADPADPGDWVSPQELALPEFAGCKVEDSSWHGTAVAGIVAAGTDNGLFGASIQWAGQVLPVRVAGKCGATVGNIVDGMRWAAGLDVAGVPRNPNPVRIVNISFGGSTACGAAYQAAVDELRVLGVVVVAAAGNEHGAVTRPASCSGVVGVAALNRDGFKSNYSNFGAELAANGLATVGGDDDDGAWGPVLADSGLLTIWNLGTRGPLAPITGHLYGTSFAAPLVSGTVALMLSVNPALSWQQIVDGLRVSARPHVHSPRIGPCSSANPGRCICTTATCGAGILDAEQAVLYAARPDSYVPPARQPEIIDNPEVAAAAALGPDRAPEMASGGTGDGGAPGAGSGGGGGGGAVGAGWLAALALAVGALAWPRRAARGLRACAAARPSRGRAARSRCRARCRSAARPAASGRRKAARPR
jgi:serine protease